ncbi:N-acyl homoserine lactonase family protein [Saccharopolyspora hirsuta]|uniref:N-acyl homoserine lactonase family protein n=1 Tax=Saccharopolyspora hirsuta TaxID=1837 RepID=UPI0014785E69|nr:N-acyl homoserine lactonase family protein [Saccharopolyspora hirsuta]
MILHPLRLGTVRGEGLPITAVLIRHPSGKNVLVDTGAPIEFAGDPEAPFEVGPDEHVLARLDQLGLSADDVHHVIATHLDPDHAGALDRFPNAEIVVQRRELEAARTSGALRYEWQRAHWDSEALHYRAVDGGTTLLDGVELVDSSGHSAGHQSVLVRLPRTGPVLIAGDAIPTAEVCDPAARPSSGHDHDVEAARQSTRELMRLVAEQGIARILHSHDAEQWRDLRASYD